MKKNYLIVKFLIENFLEKASLVRPQATHSEIKPFKCTICPEGPFFKTKSQLSHHMVFHFKPKFSCSDCDHKSKKFETKHSLKQHKKS